MLTLCQHWDTQKTFCEEAKVILLAIIGFVVLLVFGSVFNGYALSVLWGWFIVPTFHLPALSVVQAIGIAMVVSYLTYQTDARKNEDEGKSFGAKMMDSFAMSLLLPSFALLFGYIVHKFM